MNARSIRRATQRQALKADRDATMPKLYGNLDVTDSAGCAEQHWPLSDARLVANRANAQLSTGPTSEAGKKKVSLNAVKTGLTGRTVLVAGDDAKTYAEHLVKFANEWRPASDRERELVQAIADHAWRLDRVRALEMGIYARGRLELSHDIPNEQVVELETYLRYEKQLRNLHIQESRLRRYREKDTAELRCLQQERMERHAAEREAARLGAAAAPKPQPAATGFEFSTPHIAPFPEPAITGTELESEKEITRSIAA